MSPNPATGCSQCFALCNDRVVMVYVSVLLT